MKKGKYLLLAFVLVAAGFAVGAAAAKFFSSQPALAQDEGGQVLTARQFQIVDADGNMKMLLATDDDDNSPSISLYDNAGKFRAVYNLSEKDEPALMMHDKKGNTNLVIAVTKEDGEEITLYDKNMKPLWTKP